MENEKEYNYWIGKQAKIFILKDNIKLIYTAKVIDFDNTHITFSDRTGKVFCFKREFVTEMTLLGDAQ